MSIDLSALENVPRLLVEAELKVAKGGGGRFQPTGFPDLGPALYKGVRPDENGNLVSIDMLLVDSPQSIANWLEAACLDGDDYNDDCRGIPYVRVLDGHRGNDFLTSSVREPHRLASPYVLRGKLNGGGKDYKSDLASALGADKTRPVHIWKMVPEIFRRDPGCVLHGVFLEEIDGRIRLPRLVSGYIEASEPQAANSGGVYRGEVTAKDNIPYPRQEFTSTDIRASFIVHLGTLRGYRLGERVRNAHGKEQPQNPVLQQQGGWTNEEAFLILWSLYKVDRFLRGYLRPRTACEFDVRTISTAPQLASGWPSSTDILSAFKQVKDTCFAAATGANEWEQRRVRVVTYAVDVVGEAEIPEGLTDEAFTLTGFEGRAEPREEEKGKGRNKKKVRVLRIVGEWTEEEQQRLVDQNPETIGEGEQENLAHTVVKEALKKWKAAFEKLQKKASETEREPAPQTEQE